MICYLYVSLCVFSPSSASCYVILYIPLTLQCHVSCFTRFVVFVARYCIMSCLMFYLCLCPSKVYICMFLSRPGFVFVPCCPWIVPSPSDCFSPELCCVCAHVTIHVSLLNVVRVFQSLRVLQSVAIYWWSAWECLNGWNIREMIQVFSFLKQIATRTCTDAQTCPIIQLFDIARVIYSSTIDLFNQLV